MSQIHSTDPESVLAHADQIGAGNAPRPESPANPNTEGNRLEQLLPQIHELAQKVGGYDKLADLARELSRGGG
jgi:hypothetical protein